MGQGEAKEGQGVRGSGGTGAREGEGEESYDNVSMLIRRRDSIASIYGATYLNDIKNNYGTLNIILFLLNIFYLIFFTILSHICFIQTNFGASLEQKSKKTSNINKKSVTKYFTGSHKKILICLQQNNFAF